MSPSAVSATDTFITDASFTGASATDLFSRTYAATLATLAAEFAGERLETWTFDDRATRRQAEAALAERGIAARCRSAYKPLLCAFREEIETRDLVACEVIYPRHPQASEQRFRLESYPLAACYPQVAFRFVAGACLAALPVYRLHLRYADGRERECEVLAPNRVHADFTGELALSPCGWYREGGAVGKAIEATTAERLSEGRALWTAFEALYHDSVSAIRDADWCEEPYFSRLEIAVTLPVDDEPLAYDDEVLSLREALHEELYFSLLEVFQRRSGRPPGDRHLRPGQIVPQVRRGATLSVQVRVVTHAASAQPSPQDGLPAGHWRALLESPPGPLAPAVIAAALAALPGSRFQARSVAGRTLSGCHIAGRDRAVMISAGQHANETSSPAGSLQAAFTLARRPGAHFTLCPLENPDGYALHQQLIADNPRHMHHAARYTALGDDLEYRASARFESTIRTQAEQLSGAQLHLNLHGYPAHEWTRPLSGYVPRGFEMWTIPKGFFLILRYRPGWEAAARWLLEAVTRALAEEVALKALNRRQLAQFNAHAGDDGFERINGFPCWLSVDERHRVPLTLITEYPDETVYADAFQAAAAAQRATVLAAYEAFQRLPAGLLAPGPA
ncbi:M14 family zinc carboxypeptidase [Salinicola sp. DM10]|uniref:M14 family zinc carboxypeptidase n=1 Tax=Salinicola sp. DM10 TaxID=2815721 RepID=UPI001E429E6F|nr:M14 family zinc carboxypeptidase [Salinicola sp. DM10]MCE3028673.1 peptidase M14 [Salinicola sp. DM10]